ncbi:unnamed protein product, partial [Didymodactylos carnosus]
MSGQVSVGSRLHEST